MHVDGRCHCGAIRFEAEIDPDRVGLCHCTDCQVFGSAGFRASVIVSGDDFRPLEGTPAIYEKTAESGAARELAFCARCGTHVYGVNAIGDTRFFSIRVGTLDQRDALRPSARVWCRSAPDWVEDLSEMRCIDTQ